VILYSKVYKAFLIYLIAMVSSELVLKTVGGRNKRQIGRKIRKSNRDWNKSNNSPPLKSFNFAQPVKIYLPKNAALETSVANSNVTLSEPECADGFYRLELTDGTFYGLMQNDVFEYYNSSESKLMRVQKTNLNVLVHDLVPINKGTAVIAYVRKLTALLSNPEKRFSETAKDLKSIVKTIRGIDSSKFDSDCVRCASSNPFEKYHGFVADVNPSGNEVTVFTHFGELVQVDTSCICPEPYRSAVLGFKHSNIVIPDEFLAPEKNVDYVPNKLSSLDNLLSDDSFNPSNNWLKIFLEKPDGEMYETFGKYVKDSGKHLFVSWETGVPEVLNLQGKDFSYLHSNKTEVVKHYEQLKSDVVEGVVDSGVLDLPNKPVFKKSLADYDNNLQKFNIAKNKFRKRLDTYVNQTSAEFRYKNNPKVLRAKNLGTLLFLMKRGSNKIFNYAPVKLCGGLKNSQLHNF
jgi:hypothetical protein